MTNLTAILSRPPGLNATYKVGQGRFYSSDEAKLWKRQAIVALRLSAWKEQPKGVYWVEFAYTLYTQRHDIDAVLKLTQDVCCNALGINDKHVGVVGLRKVRAPSKEQEYVAVGVSFEKIGSQAEWWKRAEEELVRAAGVPA